VQALLA